MRESPRILLLFIAIGIVGCHASRQEKEDHIDSLYERAHSHQDAAYDMEMRGDRDPARREGWESSAVSLYGEAKEEEAELEKEESCASQLIGAIVSGLVEGIINGIFGDDDDDCHPEYQPEY